MINRLQQVGAAFIGLMLMAVLSWGCAAPRGAEAPRPLSREHVSDSAPARASIADPAFLEQFASTFRFRLGAPTAIKPLPAGEGVLFLRSGPRSFVQDLYEWNASTGQERVLLTADQILGGAEEVLTAEELARRERQRLASRGIAAYEVARDGKRILVPLSGRLFVIDRLSGQKRELSSDRGFPIDPRLSPDGSMIACVRDGEVYVTDIESGVERAITTGAGGTITNGLAEFVAQEEMDRSKGYWWSPDSSMILAQQTDTAGVEVFHIADPMNPEKEPQSWPYPRAGRANATVRLGITSARSSGGVTTWVEWDRARHPYLARVNWPKSGPLTILVQNRTQTEQLLLEVEPTTGSTRPLIVENDAAWLNLHDEPAWLEDGSAFLWVTDAGDDERLELRRRDGSLERTLVAGLTNLDLLEVDSRGGWAYILGCERPAAVQVWRVALDGSRGPEALGDPAATHAADLAHDGSLAVLGATWKGGRREWLAINPADGRRLGTLRSVAERPPFEENLELVRVRGESGAREYEAALYRPRNFRAGEKLPVILSVYGGPGLQYATITPRGGILDQWYADHGFIVVRIDGRGTPGRGREWERAIKDDLSLIPLEDQIDGLRGLARRFPEMDLSRVGVYGWSFGGYFSAMAAMRRPDVFTCGVVGAPVCDWRDYDTHYTERFMGLPEENRAGYDAADVLTYCKDLRVPLLIVHGTADDNVYFLHSLRMTDALFRAGRPFQFLALPGFTHMVPDPVVTRSLYGRIAEFFVRELAN